MLYSSIRAYRSPLRHLLGNNQIETALTSLAYSDKWDYWQPTTPRIVTCTLICRLKDDGIAALTHHARSGYQTSVNGHVL